jgi:hypothetical protein
LGEPDGAHRNNTVLRRRQCCFEASDTEKRIGQGLQQALDAARDMPDSENKNKLIRQIGNTALFFLKTQIPVDGGQA